MKGYRFDPSRLARSSKQQERDGYAVAGELLCDPLGGGDILAEVRERVRRDPRLRELVTEVSELAGTMATNSEGTN
jgi:hypothetical protein